MNERPQIIDNSDLTRRTFLLGTGTVVAGVLLSSQALLEWRHQQLEDAKRNQYGPEAGLPFMRADQLSAQNVLQEFENVAISTNAYLRLTYEDISYRTYGDFPADRGSLQAITEKDMVTYLGTQDKTGNPLYVASLVEWSGSACMGLFGDNRVTPPNPDTNYYVGGIVRKGELKIGDNNTIDTYYLNASYIAPASS